MSPSAHPAVRSTEGRAVSVHLLRPAPPVQDAAPLRVGMPHLCAHGLSENWWLKDCGDRHWQLLARGLGSAPEALADAQGRRAYAAFTTLHLRDAQLHTVQEGDALQTDSRWFPLGRTQAYSHHLLQRDSAVVARLEMLSVLVVRERQGDNHTIVRAPFPSAHSPAHTATADPLLADAAEACADHARLIRNGAWTERFGAAAAPAVAPFEFTPCPMADFNGAGLLYFANFQALVDRALWQWGMPCDRELTRERQMVFYGNVNLGERLRVRLRAERRAGQGQWTWTQIERASDGRLMADVATHKA